MASASPEDQGYARPQRPPRQSPSLRTVGATGFFLFRGAVVAAFIAWFYLCLLSLAAGRRIPARLGTPRLRLLPALTLAMLIIALTTSGTATVAGRPGPDVELRPKVVVVVGPVGPRTADYVARGRSLASHARRLGARVTAIYPPRATWSRVARAARGANVFVYMGHGNGWPSPYPPFQTRTKNGLGLDPYQGAPSGAHRFYGERYVDGLRLAKDSVVLLVGLCYSSGNAEPGMVVPSRRIAQERVDNYGAGFLRAGARAVFSDGFSDSSYLLDDLFASDRSMRQIFWSSWRATGVGDSTFRSNRTPGMKGIVDPRLDGDYYHSFIGDPDFRASDWRGEVRRDDGRPKRDREVPADPLEDPGDPPAEDRRPDDPPSDAADRRRTTGHLHLRNGPGSGERILGYVLRGTTVLVLETREHNGPPDWLRVRLPSGREGWVWGEWVGRD